MLTYFPSVLRIDPPSDMRANRLLRISAVVFNESDSDSNPKMSGTCIGLGMLFAILRSVIFNKADV